MRAAEARAGGEDLLEETRMRRLFASTFVAVGTAALLATVAGAQMNSGAGTGTRTGSGTSRDAGTAAGSFDTVVSVDPTANRIVVENATGEQRTITLDKSTGIERRAGQGATGQTMRIAQLSPGDRIIVSGSSRAGGFQAQRIEVLPGGMNAPGMPGANPASPPGVMRPGDPNSTQPGASPRGGIGTTPTNPSGGGMGGSGTGGSGTGGAGGGAGGAGGGAGGGGGGGR
jgi:hypothetical protein